MCLFKRIGSQSRVLFPSTITCPLVGKSKPLVILSAVVFPDPLRPSSTSVSPVSTEKLTPDRIVRPPISYDTSRNSTRAIRDVLVRRASSGSIRKPSDEYAQPAASHGKARPNTSCRGCSESPRRRRCPEYSRPESDDPRRPPEFS